MNQIVLMPPSYDEKIPADHQVRLVKFSSKKIDEQVAKIIRGQDYLQSDRFLGY